MDTPFAEQRTTVEQYAAKAEEFLNDHNITVDDAAYKAHKKTLDRYKRAFFDALSWYLRMLHSDDHPEGLDESEIPSSLLKDYPVVSAVGIIESAREFSELSRQLEKQSSISAREICLYTAIYGRLLFLVPVMQLDQARQYAISEKQSQVKRKGGSTADREIIQLAKERLTGPEGSHFRREDGRPIVSKLSKELSAIRRSTPDASGATSADRIEKILREAIRNNEIL